MERVIMVEVLYFEVVEKRKPTQRLMGFKRATAWVSRGS
jgi:hypothetical protein